MAGQIQNLGDEVEGMVGEYWIARVDRWYRMWSNHWELYDGGFIGKEESYAFEDRMLIELQEAGVDIKNQELVNQFLFV